MTHSEPTDTGPGSPKPLAPSMGRKVPLVVAVIISTGILAIVLTQVAWQRLGGALEAVSWPYLIAAFSLHHVAIFLQGWRWHVLLRTMEQPLPLWHVEAINYRSVFFDLFTPAKLGSDAYRFTSLDSERHHVAGSLLALRLQGLAVTFVFAVVATAAYLPLWRLPILAGAGLGVLALTLLRKPTGTLLTSSLNRLAARDGRIGGVAGHATTVGSRFRTIASDPATLTRSTALAVVYVLVNALVYALVGLAFSVHVSFSRFVWTSTLALVAAGLPITVHGRGLSEAIAVLTLKAPGVGIENALLTSLGKYAVTLAQALLAGGATAVRRLIRAWDRERVPT